MITAVDTSVILDILSASPGHLDSSLSLFRKALGEGSLIACPVVWAEIRPFFDSENEMALTMGKLGVGFDDFGKSAADKAGLIWRAYRKNKGARERVIADFLVGSHALLKADRLLTRDRGYYRGYFENLTLLVP